jgi:hypothetical protein
MRARQAAEDEDSFDYPKAKSEARAFLGEDPSLSWLRAQALLARRHQHQQ